MLASGTEIIVVNVDNLELLAHTTEFLSALVRDTSKDMAQAQKDRILWLFGGIGTSTAMMTRRRS